MPDDKQWPEQNNSNEQADDQQMESPEQAKPAEGGYGSSTWGETEPSTQSPQQFQQAEPTSEVNPEVQQFTPDQAPVDVVPTPVAVADAPVVAAMPVAMGPKKSKKGLIIGIVVAVALVILGGGGVFAYTWYQSPQKVITDGFINAINAKTATYVGDLSLDAPTSKIKLNYNAKHSGDLASADASIVVTAEGKDYTLNGSIMNDASNNLYFKVSKLDSIVATVKTMLDASASDLTVSATIDKLVAKLDGVWVKVSSSDLQDYSTTASKSKTCLDEVSTKFKNDKSAMDEIFDVYKKNSFIVSQSSLGEKDGSIGYKIKADETMTKAFVDGLKSTKIYSAIISCDSTMAVNSSDIKASGSTPGAGSAELWVSTWSHQITKFSFTGTSEGTTMSGSISPSYPSSVDITAPTSSTTMTQLKADLTELIQSAMTASSNSSY